VGLLGIALVVGCGSGTDGLRLVPVSGVVDYEGEPVQDGVIRLIPSDGTQAPVRVRKIRQGAYEFTGRSAAAEGTYRVEIRAYRPLAGAVPSALKDDPAYDAPREQYLPKRFNADSQIDPLVISSEDSEIRQDFNL
ncbi:MAG: hypothetical protein ACIALR_05785, partial [Blastopirellula sp. JB062]